MIAVGYFVASLEVAAIDRQKVSVRQLVEGSADTGRSGALDQRDDHSTP